MKRITLVSVMCATVILGITGCTKQPQTINEAFYNKSAQESAKIALSEAKYPVVNKKGNFTITNVEIDNANTDTLIWTYKYHFNPKPNNKLKITQESIKEFAGVKKSVVNSCDTFYSYFQTGAKLRYDFYYANGTKLGSYVIDKNVCDTLEN